MKNIKVIFIVIKMIAKFQVNTKNKENNDITDYNKFVLDIKNDKSK
jgi:hypothetical protein